METRSKLRKRLGPLPGGDRRGALGADAECFSMRTVSGRELRRRAPAGLSLPEQSDSRPSSSLSNTESLFPSISSSPPSYTTSVAKLSSISSESYTPSETEDVAQSIPTVDNTAPVQVKRARQKWTKEMNAFILRTYYILTSIENDTTCYLTELHSQFCERFPDRIVSRQRIGDQRRAIMRNRLLSVEEIANIKIEAESYLNNLKNSAISQTSQSFALTQPQHTQAGRIRWTIEMNEDIMKAYYRITSIETNKTAYRKLLHRNFIEKYSHLAHITEQRVADQRRIIINNKLISDCRLEILKTDVANEIRQTNIHTNPSSNDNIINDDTNNCNILNIGDVQDSSQMNRQEIEEQLESNTEIDTTFHKALEYFETTESNFRPYIPKQKTSKKFAEIIHYINLIILPKYIDRNTSFFTQQVIIYTAAWTAAKLNGSKLTLPPAINQTYHRIQKPNWQKRLERKISDLRQYIGKLTQYINGNTSKSLCNTVNKILQRYKIHTHHEENNTQITHFLDTLKQKLLVLSSRLKRYLECTARKSQNKQFSKNERKFYQNLRTQASNLNNNVNAINRQDANSPQSDELHRFWSNTWENPVSHIEDVYWIDEEIRKQENTELMEFKSITVETFHTVLKALHNWKSPGPDRIHNYWYKKFTHIHPYLYNHINNFILNPGQMPAYITKGITYMLPKDLTDSANPAKYRPITCLQTIYKIITSCLTHCIYNHLEQNQILKEQQKGCKKHSQGCKEQLTIDTVILKQVQKYKRNLYTVYIDYKKAFDSVPHTWLIKVLDIYKIHPQIISFLQHASSTWSTNLVLNLHNNIIESDDIKIKRGIFQGDSLSPLWFCLALNPLSNILDACNYGYKLKYENNNIQQIFNLNHLLYMDDIKLYSSTKEELVHLIELTERFSHDIKMEFGIDKCKINAVKAGQNHILHYQLQTGDIIDPLQNNETYKYLGYNQAKHILDKESKFQLQKQFTHRLNSILKTQLNSKNIVKAVNTFAIPILTYSFGVLRWSKNELKQLQRKINTTMTKHRKHHPRAAIQRQTLPRSEGGRGIVDILNLHNKQITNLKNYFHNKSITSHLHNAITQNDKKLTPLNLYDRNTQNNNGQTDIQTKLALWASKSLHGRHYRDLCQPNVDKSASNAWLNYGTLFPETEGFMIAIQDQVIETKNYQKFIMKQPIADLCRKCNSASETIQHITGSCKTIVQTDYKHRHDQVSNIVHQTIALQYKFIDKSQPYYKYQPETVLENAYTKLYFDRAILTDRTVHYNRPDITLIDKTKRTGYLIDIAVPNTHNLNSTIAEKISKYTELKDEIARMWKLQKVYIVPIVLSTTGIIPRQLHQSIKTLKLPENIYVTLQKAVILNTCRIVRKFLQIDENATDHFIQRNYSITQLNINNTESN